MFILLKLDYAKFGVSNLFFSKVIEEKSLLKERLTQQTNILFRQSIATRHWLKTVDLHRITTE